MTQEQKQPQEGARPVKIYSLGRFEVVVNGESVGAHGKVQRKPLDLLKCLIACGGRKVGVSTIIPLLWPDSDGDAAAVTFDSTVHRLRRLLNCAGSVILSNGLLTLNPELVWVDVWAFERLIGQLQSISLLGDLDQDEVDKLGWQAMLLYQGHFLGNEEELPWILPIREKLRSKYHRYLLAVGEYWESSGHPHKAIELYQKGLELDSLAESLYERLMAIYQQSGQFSSAIDIYQRCRKMLWALLGIKTSTKMDELYRLVYAENGEMDSTVSNSQFSE